MKELKWIDVEKNILVTYKDGKYDEVIRYVEENLQNISHIMESDDTKLIQEINKQGTFITNRFLHYIESDGKLKAAFYMGMLRELIDYIGSKQYEQIDEKSSQLYYEQKIKTIKNMEELIVLLGKNVELNHSQICEKLGINKSTLSEFMIKAENVNIVKSKKEGRYKFYTLTDTGRKMYSQINKVKQEEDNRRQEEVYNLLRRGVQSKEQIELCTTNSNFNETNNKYVRTKMQEKFPYISEYYFDRNYEKSFFSDGDERMNLEEYLYV